MLAAAGLIVGTGSLGLALPGDVGTPDPAAVAPSGTSRLPDHLFAPSQWLDGTAKEGPIGPLAVVIGGQFRHETDAPGLVGVSAVTGEYRFLDLPGRHETDMAGVSEIALSADGTRLAYWYGGRETKSDLMIDAAGVAVYDTVTGKLAEHPIKSPTRLLGDSLLWVGDTVLLSYFDADPKSKTSALNGRTAEWIPESQMLGGSLDDVDGAEFTVLPELVATDRASVRRHLVTADGHTIRWLGTGGQVIKQISGLAVLQDGPVFVSPDGRRIGTRQDPDGASTETGEAAPALVGELGAASDRSTAVKLHTAAGPKAHQVAGWRDDDHLVVVPEMKGDGPFEYASLDVNTGRVETLVISGPNAGGGNYAFASEAWTWPSAHAVEPDWPRDGRLLPGLLAAVAVALAAGAAVSWRRSRVRR
jgi:hypothetical protein